MSDPRPLPIYRPPGAVLDLEPVKRAKAALGVDYRVIPAGPSEGARVLAFGKPDWACDFFLVSEHTNDERMQRALAWVLGEVEDDPEATLAVDTLGVIFGDGVREITPEELASEQAWADYFNGR